jgi:hypothetical protein
VVWKDEDMPAAWSTRWDFLDEFGAEARARVVKLILVGVLSTILLASGDDVMPWKRGMCDRVRLVLLRRCPQI